MLFQNLQRILFWIFLYVSLPMSRTALFPVRSSEAGQMFWSFCVSLKIEDMNYSCLMAPSFERVCMVWLHKYNENETELEMYEWLKYSLNMYAYSKSTKAYYFNLAEAASLRFTARTNEDEVLPACHQGPLFPPHTGTSISSVKKKSNTRQLYHEPK